MKGISVVIPVFNEEASIANTILEIKKYLNDIDSQSEIIAVNDGSSDKTASELNKIPDISIINHRVNKGYGASLKSGIRNAKYSDIVITDADGTYPNHEIKRLYEHYNDSRLDMVVGARIGENVSYPWYKKVPKYFILKLANYITEYRIPDINSGLRIFKKNIALKYYHLFSNGFSFTTSITVSMLCSDYDIDFVPIDYYKREGKSKIKPIRDTIGFFSLLLRIALYFRPFKFFSPIIYFLLFGSIFVLYRDIVVYGDLSQSSVLFPIFTFLFFSLGLMADLLIKRTS
ncbi:MAG: glycosyltransferase family 2 protein [Melioribacteraceae bacterium]|nr:glycosyltransferase family 2 protein [Melioribacteraceae bacterium]